MEQIVELIGAKKIHARVRKLAESISQDHQGRELTVCAVMTGSLIFTADLVRQLACPTRIVTLEASSYRSGIRNGKLRVTGLNRDKVRDHDVLLVDDIYDTGQTLSRLSQRLERLGARSIRTCVLLRKAHPGQVVMGLDYVGFEVADDFVVGYGLDLDGRYRNLPFIGKVNKSSPEC